MIIRRPVNKPRWFGLTGLSRPPVDDGVIITGIPEIDGLEFPPIIGGVPEDKKIPTKEPGIYYRNNWTLERYNPDLNDWEILPDRFVGSARYGYGSKIWGATNGNMRSSMFIAMTEYGSIWYDDTEGVVKFTPNGWLGGVIFPTHGLEGYTNSAAKLNTRGYTAPLARGQWVLDVKSIFVKRASIRKRRPNDVPIPPITVVPEFTYIDRIERTDNAREPLSEVDVIAVGWLQEPSALPGVGPIFDIHRFTKIQHLMTGYNYPDYYTGNKHFTHILISSSNLGNISIRFSNNKFSEQLIYDGNTWTGWIRLLYEGRPARLDDIKDYLLEGTFASTNIYPNRDRVDAISGFMLYGGI